MAGEGDGAALRDPEEASIWEEGCGHLWGSRPEAMQAMLGAQGGVVHPVRREERRPADTCLSQSWPFRAAEKQERALGRSRQGRKREPRV